MGLVIDESLGYGVLQHCKLGCKLAADVDSRSGCLLNSFRWWENGL